MLVVKIKVFISKGIVFILHGHGWLACRRLPVSVGQELAEARTWQNER